MTDLQKTKNQLITEVEQLRRRVSELEKSELRAKKAEEDLHKWAHIFEHADWGISVSRDETLEMMNPAYALMHGYTMEELTGQPIEKVYAPDSIHSRPERIREVEEKGHLIFEVNHIRKDGTVFPVQIDATAVKDDQGQVLYRAVNVQDLTERKRAENKLAETSQTLENIARGITDGVMLVSRDYKILWANETAAQMTGYKPEDIKGNYCHKITHNLESPCAGPDLCPVDEVVRTGNPQTSMHRHTDSEGRQSHVEVRAYPIKDKEGRILQIVHLSKDVTKRIKAEEALRESEEKYRTLFEHTGTGLIVIEEDKTVSLVNNQFCKLSGYVKEEIEGKKRSEDFALPEDHERILHYHYLRRKDLRAAPKEYESRLVDKQGEVKQVYNTVTLIPGTTRSIVSFIDITERKQAEDLLRRSEKRQKNLIQNNFDIIFESDSKGIITYISPQCEQVFGVKAEEVIGKDFQWLLKETERERMTILFQRAISGEELGTIQFVAERPDRIEVPCELKYVLEKVGDQFIGTFGAIRDLTEWRMMETQLRQAQKMEAIGTLAGGIAHDFNNILGIILGCTELSLMKLPEDDTIYPYLHQILQAGSRARDLVKQILTFTRRSDEDRKPVSPDLIVKEALKMLRATLPSTIRIEKFIETNLGMVRADPTQLHQILMNICANAAQAMQERGGVLKVSLSKTEIQKEETGLDQMIRPGPYIKLTVSDTGHGIKPEIMSRIFDPYFTTKGLGNGTGLGLAVVFGIVKSYKGSIKVQSKVGEGTIFEILLPMIEQSKADFENTDTRPILGGRERVLVVDDEESLIYAIRNRLMDLGYEVVSETSSPKALKIFESDPNKFDAVITDMTMPGLTGSELSERIFMTRPDMPIMLCTGYNETINEQTAKDMGIRAFLLKPVLLDDLARTLRQVLDGERKSSH
jgi:PAS domain S-box-containing protein